MHNKELKEFLDKHGLLYVELAKLLGLHGGDGTISDWGKRTRLTRLQHLALVGLETEGWERPSRMKSPWTPEEEQELLLLVEHRVCWMDISTVMNRSISSLRSKYERITGLRDRAMRPMQIKQEEIDLICDMFSRGVPRKVIGDKIGRGFGFIDSVIATNHIPDREATE